MPRILPDSYFGKESRAELDAREADAQKQAAEAEKKKKKDEIPQYMMPPSLSGKNKKKPDPKPKPTAPKATIAPIAIPKKRSLSTGAAAGPSPIQARLSSPEPKTSSQQPSSAPQQPGQTGGYEAWLPNEEKDRKYIDAVYAARENDKYQAKQQKKESKKQKQEVHDPELWQKWGKCSAEINNYDAPYDPSNPTQFAQYSGSDDYQQMNNAFNDRLAAANGNKRKRQGRDEGRGRNQQFQPPADSVNSTPVAEHRDYSASRSATDGPASDPNTGYDQHSDDSPPPSFEKSGEEAYARREAMAARSDAAKILADLAAGMAKGAAVKASHELPQPTAPSAQPSATADPPTEQADSRPSTSSSASSTFMSAPPTFNPEYFEMKKMQEKNRAAAEEAKLLAELEEVAAEDAPEEDGPRSKVPGQKNAAKRMMEKMGYQAGQGLGAHGDGIETALRAVHNRGGRGGQGGRGGRGGMGGRGTARIIGGERSNRTNNA